MCIRDRAYIELTNIVSKESILESLKKVLGPSKEKLIPINEKALERGAQAVRQ